MLGCRWWAVVVSCGLLACGDGGGGAADAARFDAAWSIDAAISVDACVPSTEICDGADNDCSGAVDDADDVVVCGTDGVCTGGACRYDATHLWHGVFGLGNTFWDQATAFDVASGGSGIFALTGSFHGRIDFGGGTRLSSDQADGPPDGFVAVFGNDGSYKWEDKLPGIGDFETIHVAVDSNDRVVIAAEGLIRVYDSSGVQQWEVTNGAGPGEVNILALLIDPSDDGILVAGWFVNPIDFGGGTRAAGSFLVAYDSGGTYRWDAVGFGPTEARADGLGRDGSGNFVVSASNPVSGATTTHFSTFDADGAPVGAPLVVAKMESPRIHFTTAGDMIVGAIVRDGVDPGGGAIATQSAVLVSYAPDGTFRWQKQLPWAEPFVMFGDFSATVDGDDVVYAVGKVGHPAPESPPAAFDFGGGMRGPFLGAGYIAAYDSDGGYLWDRTYPSSDLVGMTFNGVAVVDPAALVVSGWATGSFDLGSDPRTAERPRAISLLVSR